METPETIRTSLQQGEWVTSINFKDAYICIPIQEQSRNIEVSDPVSVISVQGTSIWTVHSSHGVHCHSKGGQLMALHKGLKIHQSEILSSLSLALSGTSKNVSETSWLVNLEKSDLEAKLVFHFVCYSSNHSCGRVRLTPDRWQTLQQNILELLSRLCQD